MKKSNEQTLKEVIQELLNAYKLNDGIDESRIVNLWEKIAGGFISKHTEKIYIRNKTLFIRLSSPALKNELSFAKSKLIDSLNKSVHKEVITDIVFL